MGDCGKTGCTFRPGYIGSLLLVTLLTVAVPQVCRAWQGRVIAAPEGDLLVISHQGQEKKYRLYGVDCPKRGQPYWDKAQALVSFLTQERSVDVTPLFLSNEGFEKVLVRVEGTKDYLNQQLVAYGMAWVKPEECTSHMCTEWKKLQKMARAGSIGLWADRRAVPPWLWRKAQWNEITTGTEKKRKPYVSK